MLNEHKTTRKIAAYGSVIVTLSDAATDKFAVGLPWLEKYSSKVDRMGGEGST